MPINWKSVLELHRAVGLCNGKHLTTKLYLKLRSTAQSEKFLGAEEAWGQVGSR